MRSERAVQAQERASSAADAFDSWRQSSRWTYTDGILLVEGDAAFVAPGTRSQLDLRGAPLPSVPFSTQLFSVADRPDLYIPILMVVDRYLATTKPSGKRHLTLAVKARFLVKMFEYGWLNGFYQLSDWTPQSFRTLAQQLSKGGWVHALRIQARVDLLLSELDDSTVASLCTLRGRFAVTHKALQMMRTNVAGKETASIRAAFAKRQPHAPLAMRPHFDAGQRLPTQLELVGSLATMNHLSQIDPSFGLRFCPFPQLKATAKSLTEKASVKTPNLRPEELADLLTTAHRTLNDLAPLVRSLLESVLQAKNSRVNLRTWYSSLRNESSGLSHVVASIEEHTGKRLASFGMTHDHAAGVSVEELVAAVQSAAFVMIAAMNARRRDEIENPRIGLNTESLQIVDERLGIHQCSFYIEKTAQEYVPFFVNGATAQAISTLKDFAQIAVALEAHVQTAHNSKPVSLFLRPEAVRCSKKATPFTRPRFFRFGTNTRSVAYALELFRFRGQPLRRAHVFRRAYAMLFHYRYENSSLLALQQQLGHLDLASTLHYVTDDTSTPIKDSGPSIYSKLSVAQRAALRTEQEWLDAEISAVGQEKMREFVRSVVNGRASFSGGYVRLVQRAHLALGGRIDYAQLDAARQSDSLYASLAGRGHAPLPMSHGTCMAGTGSSRLKGHCFSEQKRSLERAEASPHVCARCPFQIVSEAHLKYLRFELERLDRLASVGNPTSIQTLRYSRDRELLFRLIGLHETRITRTTCDGEPFEVV